MADRRTDAETAREASRAAARANRDPRESVRRDDVEEVYGRPFSTFSIQHNVHVVPRDDIEQVRSDEFADILQTLFDLESATSVGTVFPPFPPDNGDDSGSDSYPTVLDCGCGEGTWILGLIEEFDDVTATGVDIFFREVDQEEEEQFEPVQEYNKKVWNLNVAFRDDPAPEPDRFKQQSFDLINSRLLADGINADRWSRYIADLYNLLTRGGWLQMVEVVLQFQDRNGRLPQNDSPLTRWWDVYKSALLDSMNKEPRIGPRLYGYLRDRGFVNVTQLSYDLPIGGWKSDQELLGTRCLDNVHQMLESLSLWPFQRCTSPQMSAEEYQELIEGARQELRNPDYRLYIKV